MTPRGTYRTRLQRILREEGRRQAWLAEQVGIDQARLSVIVNGLHVDDEDLRTRIAQTLRRTVADVFDAPIDAPLDDALPEAA